MGCDTSRLPVTSDRMLPALLTGISWLRRMRQCSSKTCCNLSGCDARHPSRFTFAGKAAKFIGRLGSRIAARIERGDSERLGPSSIHTPGQPIGGSQSLHGSGREPGEDDNDKQGAIKVLGIFRPQPARHFKNVAFRASDGRSPSSAADFCGRLKPAP